MGVKWQFKGIENNTWVEKDILVKMGYLKMVQREDEKQAAMAGLQSKQLTQPGVEKHLADFGVDAESASHTQLNQLSGGMKVKVVLAAAMWQNPHILILDEPTNYLDREGLGALVLAIKEYKGGVLIISHNKEFCDSVATEKWIMKGATSASRASPRRTGRRSRPLGTKRWTMSSMARATRSMSRRRRRSVRKTGKRRLRTSRRRSRTARRNRRSPRRPGSWR